MKLEPREADHWPVPSPELVVEHAGHLAAVRPRVASLLERGRLLDAVHLVDQVLLVEALGIRDSELSALREAHRDMTARRVARGKDRSIGG